MTFKGHLLLAMAGGLLTCNYIDSPEYYLIGVAAGSILPDIDEPESYIGRRFFVLSELLKLFGLEHRTITHYFIIPLFIFIATYLFVGDPIFTPLLYGLAFGILMHDVGDMLTKGGIKGFFFPLFPTKRIALLPEPLRFYTGSVMEYLIIVILLILDYYLFQNCQITNSILNIIK